MNSGAIGISAVVLLLGTMTGLAWISQPYSEPPILVSLNTSTHNLSPGKVTIFLKASVDGHSLGHGEAKVVVTPTVPWALVSYSNDRLCIEGYTDAHGVFITNWTCYVPGEYMVTASVSKQGCIAGKSVGFLRP
jgi:hypothetical protein